jgi:hypothetical protein
VPPLTLQVYGISSVSLRAEASYYFGMRVVGAIFDISDEKMAIFSPKGASISLIALSDQTTRQLSPNHIHEGDECFQISLEDSLGLLAAVASHGVQIWSTDTGIVIAIIECITSNSIRSIAFDIREGIAFCLVADLEGISSNWAVAGWRLGDLSRNSSLVGRSSRRLLLGDKTTMLSLVCIDSLAPAVSAHFIDRGASATRYQGMANGSCLCTLKTVPKIVQSYF